MSGRKSFLDELLAEEPSPRLDSAKKGKSVRFIDNDDRSQSISVPTRNNEGLSRPIVNQSESQKQDFSVNSSAGTSGSKSRRSDWLGLLEDNDEDLVSRVSSATSRQLNQLPSTSKPSTSVPSSDIKGQSEDTSWLDTGLAERRFKDRPNTEPQQLTKQVDNSWLDIKKQVTESKKAPESSPVGLEINESEFSDGKDEAVIMQPGSLLKIDPSQLTIAYATSQKDILILQAKVAILNMEKEHLTETINQLKDNHRSEISVLKTLNEQQLTMTIDVYKRQEEMLKEERDRRMDELKNQLETSERDREELRSRYNEKVEIIEKECKEEVERLKEMHKSLIKRLTEQHEIDLDRLRRIKGQEIESVHTLHEQSNSLESLVNKWIANADRMESLYKSLVTKEDELIKGKIDSLEAKDRQFNVIEENWTTLRRSVEREREANEEAKDKLMKLIEEQRKLIVNEQHQLNNERRTFDEEKQRFEKDKRQWEEEVAQIRDKLTRESNEISRENERLAEKSIDLEKRESSLVISQLEWKNEMTREKDNLARLTGEANEERKKLAKERSKAQEMYLNLQSEQQKLENKKILFDGEKEKLKQLAELIAQNANELENAGSISLKEKEEGLRAFEMAKKISDEVNSKEAKMERRAEQLIKEAVRIEVESKRIRQEWKMLQETKHSIVCNLCGNGLTRVKFKAREIPLVPSLNNDEAYYINQEDDEIDDRMILID
uniref:Fas-binding factor 1 C-terminal domain-containing protein n=1 Tax=Tetranychus urticae TaxID=32264 RepID=T1KXC8_TETUR